MAVAAQTLGEEKPGVGVIRVAEGTLGEDSKNGDSNPGRELCALRCGRRAAKDIFKRREKFHLAGTEGGSKWSVRLDAGKVGKA